MQGVGRRALMLSTSWPVQRGEQYRVTLETPGGMVDPGESFIAAGARELLEETGYAGDPAEQLGVVTPNPALQNNRCGTLLIRNARRVGPTR